MVKYLTQSNFPKSNLNFALCMHPADLIAATTANPPLIRPEDFRKNTVKFGWELWEANPSAPAASEEAKIPPSN